MISTAESGVARPNQRMTITICPASFFIPSNPLLSQTRWEGARRSSRIALRDVGRSFKELASNASDIRIDVVLNSGSRPGISGNNCTSVTTIITKATTAVATIGIVMTGLCFSINIVLDFSVVVVVGDSDITFATTARPNLCLIVVDVVIDRRQSPSIACNNCTTVTAIITKATAAIAAIGIVASGAGSRVHVVFDVCAVIVSD